MPIIPSTENADSLIGNMTSDSGSLLGGDDFMDALGGADRVSGGDGNDTIIGNCGDEEANGDPDI